MNSKQFLAIALLGLVVASCANRQESAPATAPPAAVTSPPATPPPPPPAPARPNQWQGKTFEEFKATVYKEKFPGGAYIISGDIPIADEKQLREFFEQKVLKQSGAEDDGRIITNPVHGVWANNKKKKLSYCVSEGFGDLKQMVVDNMKEATAAWESVADVKFEHVAAQDASCSEANPAILFDVVPVNGEPYWGRAFFPNQSRDQRHLRINDLAFQFLPGASTQLVGVLRHEVGHVLGFRHEQIRLGAGHCPNGDEDELQLFTAHTPYDPASVMHYPDCDGTGDGTFTLTEIDKNGAACNYGPAAGFRMNSRLLTGRCVLPVAEPPDPNPPFTKKINAQKVAMGANKFYGPFAAEPGTTIAVSVTPVGNDLGDADLYVRLGLAATLYPNDYDCRPYLTGGVES